MTELHSAPSLEMTVFPNGNQVPVTHLPVNASVDVLLKKLGTTLPHSLIILSAGATPLEENVRLRLLQLIGRGIVLAAGEIGIGFVTRGSEFEINRMLGQSIAEREPQLSLIGIAPAEWVTYPGKLSSELSSQQNTLESHHTHFLLIDTASWEKRTELLFRFINHVIAEKISVITLLINGDEQSRAEILRSVRLDIPIVVIAGSGGFADELATLHHNPPEFIPDSALAEIIADGNIKLFPINGTPADLDRLIHRQLRGDDTLKLAWETFGIYDTNASRHQGHFQQIQLWILGLGILVTFLAIFQKTLESHSDLVLLAQLQAERTVTETTLESPPRSEISEVSGVSTAQVTVKTLPPSDALSSLWQIITYPIGLFIKWLEPFMLPLVNFLSYVIMAIPIVITTLIAATNRFNSGKKWLNLRASAEQIKREIFCYRAQVMSYSPQQVQDKTPETKLAEHLQNIAYHLMQTEVNISALHTYPHEIQRYIAKNDDGMSLLTPQRYLETRLEDQFLYYTNKSKKLEWRLVQLQWLIYIIGGISTLLAALALELWIALTTTIITALGSFVEYQQIEKNLMNVNQAATDLSNIRSWWIALSSVEQARQANIDLLVGRTERVLQGEFSSWVQEMQEALEALREQQSKDKEPVKKEEFQEEKEQVKKEEFQN